MKRKEVYFITHKLTKEERKARRDARRKANLKIDLEQDFAKGHVSKHVEGDMGLDDFFNPHLYSGPTRPGPHAGILGPQNELSLTNFFGA